MSQLSKTESDNLLASFKRGATVRDAAVECAVDKNTAQKYFTIWRDAAIWRKRDADELFAARFGFGGI